MSVNVLFVDGPTGVGKGFFLDNFLKLYKEKFPERKVETFVATDFVLKGSAKTELRKYTTYETEEEKVKGIFEGHLEILNHIQDRAQSSDAPDLFVFDRGFLTFLCYNVYKEEDRVNRDNYIDEFKKAAQEKLADLNPLFISLDTETPGVTRCVNILLARIASRGDNKTVDIDWIYKLVNNYRKYRAEMASIFTYAETCSSGEYDVIFNRYFK